VGSALALGAVLFLGTQGLRKEAVSYTSFFDESVQGLEVGSPIKFRGVTIGNVGAIFIAPDGRHVGVTSDLTVKDLTDLGLNEATGTSSRIRVPPDLRVELASQGLTGVKFVQIDFFDVRDNPPPHLSFPVPDRYIPAVVSMMKNLGDAVVHAVDRLPDMADGVLKVTAQVTKLLDEIEAEHVSENANATLAHIDQVLASLDRALVKLDTGKISDGAQRALADVGTTMERANALIARLDGDRGLVMSVKRATDAVGDVATSLTSNEFGRQLDETLRDVQEVTAALQREADALQRDPDMLLKGHGKSK
jgi:phospholipid/cholesterol/gamma-HCH transport system substrate-binding protein